MAKLFSHRSSPSALAALLHLKLPPSWDATKVTPLQPRNRARIERCAAVLSCRYYLYCLIFKFVYIYIF